MIQVQDATIIRVEYKRLNLGPFSISSNMLEDDEYAKSIIRKFADWWIDLDDRGMYPKSPFMEIKSHGLERELTTFIYGTTNEHLFEWFSPEILDELEEIGFVIKEIKVKVAWWVETTHQYLFKREDIISEETI